MSIATSTNSTVKTTARKPADTEGLSWASGYTDADISAHARALTMAYAYAAPLDAASTHDEARMWITVQLRFLSAAVVAYGLFRYVEHLSETSIRFAGQNGCYDGLPESLTCDGFPQSALTPDGFPRVALN